MTNPREPQHQASPDRPVTTEFTAAAAARIYEQHHSARYHYERESVAEWIDLGGEEGA
jgi:hypothetical protein